MEDYYLARVLRVLGVVLWIGGVAFVTLVLLPAVKRSVDPAARVEFFERLEAGFAVHLAPIWIDIRQSRSGPSV